MAASLQKSQDEVLSCLIKAVYCPLLRVPVWLAVALRLNFLWKLTSSTTSGTENFRAMRPL